MSLKEITKDLHTAAEKTAFSQALIRGTVTKEQYADYLYQLLAIYDPIEFFSADQGFFDNLEGLQRLRAIYDDFVELREEGKHYKITPSTLEYHMYLINLANNEDTKHLIKAHMYVRHMGDLNGGQIIKRQLPFSSGKFYEFENADKLKVAIRSELSDDLGEEARRAFEWNIKMMEDLM